MDPANKTSCIKYYYNENVLDELPFMQRALFDFEKIGNEEVSFKNITDSLKDLIKEKQNEALPTTVRMASNISVVVSILFSCTLIGILACEVLSKRKILPFTYLTNKFGSLNIQKTTLLLATLSTVLKLATTYLDNRAFQKAKDLWENDYQDELDLLRRWWGDEKFSQSESIKVFDAMAQLSSHDIEGFDEEQQKARTDKIENAIESLRAKRQVIQNLPFAVREIIFPR
jgi:hypothetical protein